MTRSELWQALAKSNPEWRARDVANATDVFFEEISQRLADGGRVELRGFGVFSTHRLNARKGRKSRTGESVDVPTKRALHFKPSKEILGRLKIG